MKTNPIMPLKLSYGENSPVTKQMNGQSVDAPLRIYTAIFLFALVSLLISCDNPADEIVDQNAEIQLEESKAMPFSPGPVTVLASGLAGASGSTVGPGGSLFVTEGAAGQISRIDPKTGEVSPFATGFPPSLIGIGGVYDVAFLGWTAYALVTLVDDPNLFPTGDVNGIYRVDGPNSFTIIADIGAFNLANPPTGFDFFVSTGVQYAIQPYRGGFLVSDGHMNRVLYVTLDGEITIVKQFENIVPTGLDTRGHMIYMAQTGPVPHNPEDGKVVSFGPYSSYVRNVASGAPMIVDVEFHRGRTLFALSQGEFGGGPDGSPAINDDGALLQVNPNGTFRVVAEGLDQPTSFEFIQNSAYIVTLGGEVLMIDNVACPPFGRWHGWKGGHH